MSKQTLILIIILFLITGGLLILALNKPFYNPKDLSQPPIPSINPVTATSDVAVAQTSLLFGNLSAAYPIELGSKKPPVYSLPIKINTGTNKITSVQLELSFDPNILTKVNITPSNFFKNPNVVINKINYDTGKISYALAASNSALAESNAAVAKSASESANPAQRGKQREGTLVTLTFESRIPSVPSAITFLSRTFVTAEGLDTSALKSTNSAQLQL